MFREYTQLVNEAIKEGVQRGVDLFLEGLNQEMVLDQISESYDGIDNVLRGLFEEEGYSVTEFEALVEGEEEAAQEPVEESAQEDAQEPVQETRVMTFEEKLDAVLEDLKGTELGDE